LRDANADTDDGSGNPQPPDWQPNLEDLPCRAWASAGRETVTDTTTVVVVEDLRLIVSLGTDVTEADRVASVTFRGQPTQAGPLGIRAVLTHQDHIELVLVKVS
jgi:hypothetical protein